MLLGCAILRKGVWIALAQRVTWEEANGPLPEGQIVRAHCGSRVCVNPEHLYADEQEGGRRSRRMPRCYYGR